MTARHRERLAELLREEISRVVIEEMADPRVGFATVTGVEVSEDLANALVHVSLYQPEGKRRAALKALNHSAGFIRRKVMPHVRSRRMPYFRFVLDEGTERSARIADLLREAGTGESAGGDDAGTAEDGGDRDADE